MKVTIPKHIKVINELEQENQKLLKRVKELKAQMDRIIIDLSDKGGKLLLRAEKAEKRVDELEFLLNVETRDANILAEKVVEFENLDKAEKDD